MANRLLLSLAVPWGLMWLLVSLLEVPIYLHDPARPLWQPAAVLGSSILAAALVVVTWLRSGAFARPRWLVSAASWAPAYVAGMVAMHYGLRAGLFALAGARYDLTPSDTHPVFQALKYTTFYALWIALAFGAKAFFAARDRAVAPAAGRPGLARLQVPVGDKIRLIEAAAIDWVEADDNYVRIHTGGQDYALRGTLRQVLAELGDELFVRIHRSAAVNIARIDTLQPLAKGDAELALRNGDKLRVSRRFRHALHGRLQP